MKLLHISDCHIGLTYAGVRDSHAREEIVASRLTALKNAVDIANDQKCDAMVIAGDLFENTKVTQKLIKEVCRILSMYSYGTVWVLPGNHDYYDDSSDNQLWEHFTEEASDHVYLFKENKMIETVIDGKTIRFYPCICTEKHALESAIGWIDSEDIDPKTINIGIAHGSLAGLSYDKEGSYYAMTPEELMAIPVDVWLLGHAHVPEPSIACDKKVSGKKIFNAGTHEQTNIHNNTVGSVFFIDIHDDKTIEATRLKTGVLTFTEASLKMNPTEDLKAETDKIISGLDAEHTVLRLSVTGTVSGDDYERRNQIEEDAASKVLYMDKIDMDVAKEITPQMIDEDTVVGSVENTLLKRYIDNPEMLAACYDLVMACKEK